MKRVSAIVVSALAMAGLTANAEEADFRTDINPALLYYQAFLVAPDPMSATNLDYLYSKEGRSQPLPERFGALAAGYNSQFKLVRRAAQAKMPCDWGIDMSDGAATLLPHLARAKAIAQAARLRVMWDLQHERQADACDDLLASVALGRNLSRDGTMISTLVQIAIEAIECNVIAENLGQFTPESLQRLVDGLKALPPRGTVAASIAAEKRLFGDPLERKILALREANPGDDAKVMAGIRKLFGAFDEPEEGQPKLWETATNAAGGTSEGILKLFREEGQLYLKLAGLAALPPLEYERELKTFNEELQKSGNPLAQMMLPALEKGRLRELRALVTLAMVRAAVEYKTRGDAGFQTVNDPAGEGPFALRRFILEGVDRGFELKSALDAGGFQVVLIFVEKAGPPFRVDGPHAGESIQSQDPAKDSSRR